MNQMMRETIRIGTARRAELPGWPVAGKTGTSQDFRDAWFVGFTGRMVTGVWFGNDDASPTKRLTGGSLPVDVWSKVMKTAHQGLPVVPLPGAFALPANDPPIAPPSAPAGDGMARIVPPANIGATQTRQPRQEAGVDSWLLDRLLPRR
jgi:penicillin-binding protein 1A